MGKNGKAPAIISKWNGNAFMVGSVTVVRTEVFPQTQLIS